MMDYGILYNSATRIRLEGYTDAELAELARWLLHVKPYSSSGFSRIWTFPSNIQSSYTAIIWAVSTWFATQFFMLGLSTSRCTTTSFENASWLEMLTCNTFNMNLHTVDIFMKTAS